MRIACSLEMLGCVYLWYILAYDPYQHTFLGRRRPDGGKYRSVKRGEGEGAESNSVSLDIAYLIKKISTQTPPLTTPLCPRLPSREYSTWIHRWPSFGKRARSSRYPRWCDLRKAGRVDVQKVGSSVD